MTTNYHIDIHQNEQKLSKTLRPIGLMFVFAFFLTGLIGLIIAIIRHDFNKLFLAIAPLILAFVLYLQVQGKLIFSQYLTINDTGIYWKKSLVDSCSVKWTNIKLVHFEYASIIFQLSYGQKKFYLTHITMTQISELKDVLGNKCEIENIEFISN